MTAEITIRPVRAGDVETLQSLFQQEAAHNGFALDEGSPYHPANAATTVVSASLDADDPDCGWIAFSDGRPAGLITTPQGLAGGVFVAGAFRGQGIAQALVETRERYFKENLGLTEIERPIRADNLASLKLHTEKLGYHFNRASQALLEQAAPGGQTSPLEKAAALPGHTVLYVAKTL